MILGISGKIGSGKDTIGQIVQYLLVKQRVGNNLCSFDKFKMENFKSEQNFEIKKFADKLKDIVCLLINCTREQLEDQEFKNTELGEEWIVYYYTNYKFKSQNNSKGKISKLFISKEEAILYKETKSNYDWGLCSSSILEFEILTPRLLLQLLGTDCGRNIVHPNIWINSLFSEYREKLGLHSFDPLKARDLFKGIYNAMLEDMLPNWIITDTRFPNELKAIKDRKGISIRVNRNQYWYLGNLYNLNDLFSEVRKDTGEYASLDYINENWLNKGSTHESETALDSTEFDYTINNDGTIEDLIEKVKEILIKENLIK